MQSAVDSCAWLQGMSPGGCSAVACTTGSGDFLGDRGGSVWHIGTSLDAGACHQRIIHLPGTEIQGITAADNTVVLTTTCNSVYVFQRTEGGWIPQEQVCCHSPMWSLQEMSVHRGTPCMHCTPVMGTTQWDALYTC